MPWTPREKRFLLSKASPLSAAQKDKMKAELHDNPALGHAKKGSEELREAARERMKSETANYRGKSSTYSKNRPVRKVQNRYAR